MTSFVGFRGNSRFALGPDAEWDVIVTYDKECNAYSSPGVIVVNTGILQSFQNEHELAWVIGHGTSRIKLIHCIHCLRSFT